MYPPWVFLQYDMRAPFNIFAFGETLAELQAQCPAHFDRWEKEVIGAEPIFELAGQKLEVIARAVPHHQFKYAGLAQEAKALMKLLETHLDKVEAKYAKNYAQGAKALGQRETQQYIQGEREVVDLKQLIVQANLLQNQLEEIVEAIKQMGWMLGNVVKLRVAELQDTII
jgi:hypothetical protein